MPGFNQRNLDRIGQIEGALLNSKSRFEMHVRVPLEIDRKISEPVLKLRFWRNRPLACSVTLSACRGFSRQIAAKAGWQPVQPNFRTGSQTLWLMGRL